MHYCLKHLPLLLLATISYAQELNWQWQNPLPQGNDLSAVHFIDSSTVVAVGDGGTVMRSTDAGLTWLVAASICGISTRLQEFTFLNSDTAIIVGDAGVILWTGDRANTFERLPSGTTENLVGIAFAAERTGTIVGWFGALLRTIDGGRTWQKQTVPSGGSLFGVQYMTSTKGVAYGPLELLRTSDGGASWVETTQPLGFDDAWSFCFTDSLTGEIGTYRGKILRTIDGGTTYSERWAAGGDVPGVNVPVRILFVNDTVGFALNGNISVSINPTTVAVLRTTDGGKSWTNQSIPDLFWLLNGISFANTTTGLIVGDGGIILRTTDGGSSWQLVTRGFLDDLYAVSFVDTMNGTAVGNGGIIIHTSDGGHSWVRQESGVRTGLRGVNFSDPLTGTVVGYAGTILRTTDGGSTWVRQSAGSDSNWAFFCVSFLNAEIGYVAGVWDVLQTRDGGNSWTIKRFEGAMFNDIEVIDSLDVLAVGGVDHRLFPDPAPGLIYRTSDGGGNWMAETSFQGGGIGRIAFTNADTLCIPGANIWRSTNSGTTWAQVPAGSDPLEGYPALRFADRKFGVMASGLGKLFYTEDAGLSWQRKQTTTINFVTDLSVKSNGWVTVIGNRGKIVHTSINRNAASVRQAEEKSEPLRFAISQNYPNPFNPSTIISYQIPRAGFVSLKIYNLLGQEVAMLVSEEKLPGEYRVGWDGTGVSSGVYFYTLTAGTYKETKKLLLLK